MRIRFESIEPLEEWPGFNRPNVFYTLFHAFPTFDSREELGAIRVDDRIAAKLETGEVLDCIASIGIVKSAFGEPYLGITSLLIGDVTVNL